MGIKGFGEKSSKTVHNRYIENFIEKHIFLKSLIFQILSIPFIHSHAVFVCLTHSYGERGAPGPGCLVMCWPLKHYARVSEGAGYMWSRVSPYYRCDCKCTVLAAPLPCYCPSCQPVANQPEAQSRPGRGWAWSHGDIFGILFIRHFALSPLSKDGKQTPHTDRPGVGLV